MSFLKKIGKSIGSFAKKSVAEVGSFMKKLPDNIEKVGTVIQQGAGDVASVLEKGKDIAQKIASVDPTGLSSAVASGLGAGASGVRAIGDVGKIGSQLVSGDVSGALATGKKAKTDIKSAVIQGTQALQKGGQALPKVAPLLL